MVYDHVKKNDLEKYLKYVVSDAKDGISQFRPKFLVAPYFFLDANDTDFDSWLRVNTELATISVEQAVNNYTSIGVFAQIVVSKSVLIDNLRIQQIANEYQSVNCFGYAVWVDDLNETEATECELLGFVSLLKALKVNGKPIYNMYGGYFSIMLTHKKVDLLGGVSHGLEYGESRKVYPVGGGIPVSKYYYYPLHQRLDFTKAFYLLVHIDAINTELENWGASDNYYRDVCKCKQCKKVIKSEMINFIEFESRESYEVRRYNHVYRRKKASPDTRENCLYHFLLCKHKEFTSVNRSTLDGMIKELSMQKATYVECEALKEAELTYLDTWISAIKNVGLDRIEQLG